VPVYLPHTIAVCMETGGLLAILAGAAGLYLWSKGRAATNLLFFPGNITGFSLNGIYPVLYINLLVQNTNNTSFHLNSLAGNVTSNGTQIGNISNFTGVEIPGNSQINVPITLTLQPLTLVNDIIGIITGGSGSRDLKLDAVANVDGVQATFSLSYKLGV
jgi:hypothetical protein